MLICVFRAIRPTYSEEKRPTPVRDLGQALRLHPRRLGQRRQPLLPVSLRVHRLPRPVGHTSRAQYAPQPVLHPYHIAPTCLAADPAGSGRHVPIMPILPSLFDRILLQ